MSFLTSITGVLSKVQINLHTWRHGTLIGVDQFGNRYYKGKARKGYNRERRWVLYKSGTDASQVPPEWHGWLHYQSDTIPGKGVRNEHRQEWQQEHVANMTGTKEAYLPPGHVLKGGQRQKATGDYVAWTPPK